MNPLFRLAMFSLAVAASAPCAARTTLHVVGQESIPPKWVVDDGKFSGVCPDILAAIEKMEPRLRFSGVAEARSMAFIEQGLETGKIDAACALLDTERRRDIAVIVGPPLYTVRHRLAARSSDAVAVASMEQLIALKPIINTPRNAGYANQLRALGLDVDDNTGDNTVNLKKIIAGHGRFFYINELTLTWMLEKPEFKGKVRMLDWLVKEEPIYFHISKKTPAAAARMVDRALVKLKDNGELARIYARWSQGR